MNLYDLLTGWVPDGYADYRLPVAMVLATIAFVIPPLAIGLLGTYAPYWIHEVRVHRARKADPSSRYLPAAYLMREERAGRRAGLALVVAAAIVAVLAILAIHTPLL
jgi:hypothetical protein